MKITSLLCCLPFGLRFQLRPNKSGKPMTPHLLRYQELAVDDYSCGLDALSQWNEDPVIGGPACPVKCEAYFTGAVSSTFATLGFRDDTISVKYRRFFIRSAPWQPWSHKCQELHNGGWKALLSFSWSGCQARRTISLLVSSRYPGKRSGFYPIFK